MSLHAYPPRVLSYIFHTEQQDVCTHSANQYLTWLIQWFRASGTGNGFGQHMGLIQCQSAILPTVPLL